MAKQFIIKSLTILAIGAVVVLFFYWNATHLMNAYEVVVFIFIHFPPFFRHGIANLMRHFSTFQNILVPAFGRSAMSAI